MFSLIFGLFKRGIKQLLCPHKNVETVYTQIEKKTHLIRLAQEKTCLDCGKRIDFTIEDKAFADEYAQGEFIKEE